MDTAGNSQFYTLRDNYKKIRNCKLLTDKYLNNENIEEFQRILNDSQPLSEQDICQRNVVQFLYRRNPANFCQFLSRSGLNSFVLWTEAKSIVAHFGLRGILYIKWDNESSRYVCSIHKNVMNGDDKQKIYENIGRINNGSFGLRRRDGGNMGYRERYRRNTNTYERRGRGTNVDDIRYVNSPDNFPPLAIRDVDKKPLGNGETQRETIRLGKNYGETIPEAPLD